VKPDGQVFDAFCREICTVGEASRAEVDAMIKRHYIGKWPGVCVLVLAMRCGTKALGMVVFALPPQETVRRYGGITWELARLWIDDSVPQNAETWLIAKAVRHIRRKHPSVEVLVSYADPSAGHSGGVYRAANWTADGRTDDDRKSARNDYADARTGRRYSRRSHVPADAVVQRVPRTSKPRFIYRMR
jgi:hypothetical protein